MKSANISTRILGLIAFGLTACQAISLTINDDGTSDNTLAWTPVEHIDYYTGNDVITLLDAIGKLHTDTLGLHSTTITNVEKIADDAITNIKNEITSDNAAWTTYDTDVAALIDALDPTIRLQTNPDANSGNGTSTPDDGNGNGAGGDDGSSPSLTT